jgi:hypothetical protein
VEVVGNRSYAEVLVGWREFLASSSLYGNYTVYALKGQIVTGQVLSGGSEDP